MAKKISVILAIFMLFTCVFASCSSASSIVGTWDDNDGTIFCFKSDGTGYAEIDGTELDITFTVKGDKLTVTIDGTAALEELLGMSIEEIIDLGVVTEEDLDDLKETETSTFKVNGDVLYLDGDEFYKVK